MPVFLYECQQCGETFDRLVLSPTDAQRKRAACPACGSAARRTFAGHRFASPSIGRSGELAEDSDQYRKMHYHEKRGEWEKASRAAEGVSEFARKRFQEKAERRDPPGTK